VFIVEKGVVAIVKRDVERDDDSNMETSEHGIMGHGYALSLSLSLSLNW